MRIKKYIIGVGLFWAMISLAGVSILAQGKITSPKEHFGCSVGDDYHLISYRGLESYWRKLEKESDRMSLVEIGTTCEGRRMLMAVITSPENQKKLSRYKEISRCLALAEGLTDEEARKLASEGRSVVWIDGGLHSTEVLGHQQLIEIVYQMASQNDEETHRILDNVILLAVCSNPDGMDLIANWYMREKDPAKRSTSGLPRLYHKYIGHDNNRDFYMVTQPETEAIARILYHEWFPQIVYNHHQTGPAGTVLFCAPFRDPFNYLFDPLVPMGIDLVGAAIHSRFVAEGKPGATMRSGAGYSTWWSGGLRSTAYFHNMIGILTETIGNPSPIEIPFVLQRQLPKGDLPSPIAPQKWHFRQSVEYSITADRAILDLASRLREDFLFKIYRMGKNSIERGNRDNWTISPKRIAAVEEALQKDNVQAARTGSTRGSYPVKYYELLRNPADRDPRGYILPSNQPDFLTAVKFMNTLIINGVAVHRAARDFEVAGKTYPAGSFIVKCSQAFRPHILAMFEAQDHPNDIPYPGGPPTAPYDSAGWTLALQMGVEFDRILDGFDGPFENVKGLVQPLAGLVSQIETPAGFLLSHRVNDVFVAVSRLLKGGEEVYRLKTAFQSGEKFFPAGTFYVPGRDSARLILEKTANEFGLQVEAAETVPSGDALRLKPVRIGLWDSYGGSMASGWARWLLEQYEIPFELVFPAELDAGNLAARFDVLIFVGGAIPLEDRTQGEEESRWFAQPKPEEIPPEFRNRLGIVTVSKTVPHIKKFLEEGGTLLAIGSSTSMAFHAGLPVEDALSEKLPDGTTKRLPREKYYIPGSLLRVAVDNSHPLAYGMPEKADVYFNNSPVFTILPEALLKGIRPVAWFDSSAPLRSGWAWGQHYLKGGAAVMEANVGKGTLLLLGPEIIFRGQPHGTFKFFFNSIFLGGATSVRLP